MKNKLKQEELNYENFNIFVLGYDLLQEELNDRDLDVDTAFEVCNRVYNDYLLSEYNDSNRSEYECMRDYIDDQNSFYFDNIINDINGVRNEDDSEQKEDIPIMYIISGWAEDNHFGEIWSSEVIFIDTPDEKNWENIIKEFNYYCNKANSLGDYSDYYSWCVSIKRLKGYKNGSIAPESLVLKMNKKLYQEFKSIIDYPITPNFNHVLVDEDNPYRYKLVNWRDELYYDKDGNTPTFKTCADAWEYIFQNGLIS